MSPHPVARRKKLPTPNHPQTVASLNVRCILSTVPKTPLEFGNLTRHSTRNMAKEGCPLATAMEEDLQFESLLVDLSSTFVNLAASEVDLQIEDALRRVAEFLDVDRITFGELKDESKVVLTHSYATPTVLSYSGVITNEQLPWWSEQVRRGVLLRFARLPDELPFDAVNEREFCAREGIKSHLTIPIKVGRTVLCVITFVAIRSYQDWPDNLIRRLHLLGEILANALARKWVHEELRVREQALQQSSESLRQLTAKLLHAQEEERRRIAREMHDDWTQRLALMSINIAKIETHLGSPEKALTLLRAMQEQLVGLSEDVHDLSRQLHPSILDDLGLVEALRSECASFSRREGIAVDYRPEAVPTNLPKNVSLCVYRVAQEALRNLAKHAAVNEAWVTLSSVGSELLLRIEDKGIGFDPVSVCAEPGLGLTSMEERVTLIQAKLSITSAPGRGTTVEVTVPLARSLS